MRVAIWVPGTPEHFLIHVHGAFHVIKQMGLDTEFQEAANAVENLKFDWDIKKDAHSKTKKDKKKKDNGPPHAAVLATGTALDRVPSTWEKAGAKAIIRTQIFQLYANLLSNEACQPWDKIVKAQTKNAPREDLK